MMFDHDAEWIFMLDSDVIPPPDAIERLLGCNHKIASGVYYRRNLPIEPGLWNETKDGTTFLHDYPKTMRFEVDLCGAGCLLIHRDVFERLKKPYFEWTLDKLPKPAGSSEDFNFLRKARKELGIRPMIDPNVQCQHIGLFGSSIHGLIPCGDSIAVRDRFDWIRSRAFGSIIDIGSNEGKTFKGRSDVTHVDLDTYDIPNFIQADASKIPVFDKSHDCAVLGEILEHVPDVGAVLREAKRIARHKVLITTPNEYEWEDRHLPSHKFPKERVAEMRGKSMKELAVEACKITNAVATVDEETNPHLYHVRQFNEEMIRREVSAVFPRYTMEMLRYDGWSFFAIEAEVGE